MSGSSETPIRLPNTSTSIESTCTSVTSVVSTGVGFVGPGGRLMQDTEYRCLGSLVDTVSSIDYRCHSSGSIDNMTRSLSNGSER